MVWDRVTATKEKMLRPEKTNANVAIITYLLRIESPKLRPVLTLSGDFRDRANTQSIIDSSRTIVTEFPRQSTIWCNFFATD